MFSEDTSDFGSGFGVFGSDDEPFGVPDADLVDLSASVSPDAGVVDLSASVSPDAGVVDDVSASDLIDASGVPDAAFFADADLVDRSTAVVADVSASGVPDTAAAAAAAASFALTWDSDAASPDFLTIELGGFPLCFPLGFPIGFPLVSANA